MNAHIGTGLPYRLASYQNIAPLIIFTPYTPLLISMFTKKKKGNILLQSGVYDIIKSIYSDNVQ